MKKYILLFIAVISTSALFAQDPFAALDSGTAQAPEYVTATFKGTRLIDFQTVETPGKNTMDFRISHRFADLNTGAQNAFGLDGPASLWIGFDYSFNGRFVIGIGRVNVEKLGTGFVKYKLLRQTLHSEKMPVTVTLLAESDIDTRTSQQADNPDEFSHFSDRLKYTYQVMIARKFSSALSLQVSPTIVHYNLVQGISDRNDLFALPVLARWKFSRSVALTGEYGFRLNNNLPNTQGIQAVAGLGFDVETGGHVFQLFVTNGFGIAESQTLTETTDKISKGQVRLGFNISRMFSF